MRLQLGSVESTLAMEAAIDSAGAMKYVVVAKRPGATWLEVSTVDAPSKDAATEKALNGAEHLITVPREIYDALCDELGGEWPTVEELREADKET